MTPDLERLARLHAADDRPYPQLKAVVLAQWLLQSADGSSDLARRAYNFADLPWRPEMAAHATRVTDKDDPAYGYCRFASLQAFIRGYWAFLDRAPYSGWEARTDTGEAFIRFVGPVFSPSPTYADRVLARLKEAERLLEQTSTPRPPTVGPIYRLVLDPGHGGHSALPGSSANNAISVSGAKEKTLTLEFCALLKEALENQAEASGRSIAVTLTRTLDINLSAAARAAKARSEGASAFLSLHFNGGKPTTRGAETFYRAEANGNLNLKADIVFATAVQQSLISALRGLDSATPDRGVKPDTQTGPGSLAVLSDVNLGNRRGVPNIAAALTEVEFITNPKVDRLLIAGPEAIVNRRKLMKDWARELLVRLPSSTDARS